MTFVSYAQNHEDVMLARVFRGVGPGFYLDVGAQDPRIDSVTKAFYDQGWHGINLEPVEAWYEKLRQDRPRDTNLCVAAGATEGMLDFHEVVDTGLSTSSEEFARRHQAQGHQVRSRRVPVRTLDAICAEHGVERVHFLKVDAEGAEADVLRGIDLRKWRPWVILVEATEPNSDVGTQDQWESLVLDRGYTFVYDDGLNRFYLADEHLRLRAAFATPPNVFDDFVPRQLVDYRGHADGLARQVVELEGVSKLRAEAIERLDGIVADKDQDLQRHAAVLAEHVARLAQQHAELTQVHQDLLEREDLLMRSRSMLAERDASLAQSQSELASLREVAAGLERELQARKARITLLATRLQGSEQAVAELSRSLLDVQAARHAAEAGWAALLADHQATLADLAQAQRDFQAIVGSRSWRLTRPLRQFMTWAMALRARLRPLPPARVVDAQPLVASGASDAAVDTGDAMIEPAPPSPLPISEDAERILAEHPVLAADRRHQDAH